MAHSLLLADDSPTIAKILGMALQPEGYEIRSVLTAADALKALDEKTPFFFLVDISLPETSGLEFARLVRATPKLQSVRVVLLSSAFEPLDEFLVRACEADGVIAKPFDPGELRQALREIASRPPGSGTLFPKTSSAEAPPPPPPTASASPAAANPTPPPPAPNKPPAPASAATPSTPPGPPPGAPARAAPPAPPTSPPPAPTSAAPIPAPAPALEPSPGLELPSSTDDELASLLQTNQSGDADSILSSILGADEGAELPPPAPTEALELSASIPEAPPVQERTNATVMLDLTDKPPAFEPQDSVLDLSGAFETGSETPPPHTFTDTLRPPPATEPAKPSAKAAMVDAPPPPRAPSTEPLSVHAEALAAFFAAEIDGQAGNKVPPPTASPAETEDSFDASLSSIDWGGADNLNDWSSTPPSRVPETPEAPPAAPVTASAASAPTASAAPAAAYAAPTASAAPTAPTTKIAPPLAEEPMAAPAPASFGAGPDPLAVVTRHSAERSTPRPAVARESSGASLLSDTGGSNFRFSEDYVQRITRSFEGSGQEAAPVFPRSSDDRPRTNDDRPRTNDDRSRSNDDRPRPPAATEARAPFPQPGSGAWTDEEMKRIETIVRQEVQMVVREVAEKVAWEILPELAENILRKELEKVLQEIDQEEGR